jgi:hypothetical protein
MRHIARRGAEIRLASRADSVVGSKKSKQMIYEKQKP